MATIDLSELVAHDVAIGHHRVSKITFFFRNEPVELEDDGTVLACQMALLIWPTNVGVRQDIYKTFGETKSLNLTTMRTELASVPFRDKNKAHAQLDEFDFDLFMASAAKAQQRVLEKRLNDAQMSIEAIEQTLQRAKAWREKLVSMMSNLPYVATIVHQPPLVSDAGVEIAHIESAKRQRAD